MSSVTVSSLMARQSESMIARVQQNCIIDEQIKYITVIIISNGPHIHAQSSCQYHHKYELLMFSCINKIFWT